jgi:hypothetical protein
VSCCRLHTFLSPNSHELNRRVEGLADKFDVCAQPHKVTDHHTSTLFPLHPSRSLLCHACAVSAGDQHPTFFALLPRHSLCVRLLPPITRLLFSCSAPGGATQPTCTFRSLNVACRNHAPSLLLLRETLYDSWRPTLLATPLSSVMEKTRRTLSCLSSSKSPTLQRT